MSKRKKSRVVHGRDGERDSLSDNPIIAAVRKSLPGRGSVIWDVDAPPLHVLRLMITNIFRDESIREIGILIIGSLLTGDGRIVDTVGDALKKARHIFKQDRELVLRKKVVKYLPDLLGLDIMAIKKEIEKRSNNGHTLQRYRWNRLSKALQLAELPKLPTGAAAPAYKRKSRRKLGTKR